MKVLRFLNSMIDVVLPRKERRQRTDTRMLSDIPLSPTTHELLLPAPSGARQTGGTTIVTLTEYREPAVAELIQSLKYDRSGHAARLCAGVLADFLREEISSTRTFSAKNILLVPVPLHAARIRERGFNQIEVVLEALPQEFQDGTVSRLETQALARTRATKQQTRLSRKERLANVAGAFARAHASERVTGSHVFLIDDVTTTGATLSEAAKPLEEAGISVTLIALARA